MAFIPFTILALLLVVGVIFVCLIFWAIIGGIGQMILDLSKAFKNHFCKRNEIKRL